MVAQSDGEGGSGCGSVPGDRWPSGGAQQRVAGAGESSLPQISALFSSSPIELLWLSQPLDFCQKIRKNTFCPGMENKKPSVTLALKFPAFLGLSFKEKGGPRVSEENLWGRRADCPKDKCFPGREPRDSEISLHCVMYIEKGCISIPGSLFERWMQASHQRWP